MKKNNNTNYSLWWTPTQPPFKTDFLSFFSNRVSQKSRKYISQEKI